MDLNLCLKILDADQIRKADQFTIKTEPIHSIDLMERASEVFVNWLLEEFPNNNPVAIFCGTGNNGGDGLVIARLLQEHGYNVEVYCIGTVENGSRDFNINFDFIQNYFSPQVLESQNHFPSLGIDTVVIDAIFGSGLSRKVAGLYADLINHINFLPCEIKIAVDIASGLGCCEKFEESPVLQVSHTLTFHVPKLSLFLPANLPFTGDVEVLNIGLNEEYIQSLPSDYFLTTTNFIQKLIKKRSKFAHKGNMGKDLIVAGSLGKMGAAVLAASGCMRAGAGLLTVHTPQCGLEILQTSLPEAMVSIDQQDHQVSHIDNIELYNTIGLGPGIGTEEETVNCVKQIIKESSNPLVLDADAINILATNPELISDLPDNSILTPHPGEFKRLVGDWSNDYDRLKKQKAFSEENKVIMLLKGAYTSISDPSGRVVFNSTGNPGMATGGSGDVLLGIITGLVGQGYDCFQSAILGAYLHGLAADIYVSEYSEEALIASDLVAFLPEAFRAVKEFQLEN